MSSEAVEEPDTRDPEPAPDWDSSRGAFPKRQDCGDGKRWAGAGGWGGETGWSVVDLCNIVIGYMLLHNRANPETVPEAGRGLQLVTASTRRCSSAAGGTKVQEGNHRGRRGMRGKDSPARSARFLCGPELLWKGRLSLVITYSRLQTLRRVWEDQQQGKTHLQGNTSDAESLPQEM